MADTALLHFLKRHEAGSDSARAHLLEYCIDRLRQLAAWIFRPQRDLRRLHETDDVVQRALVRLHRALVSVKPADARAFFGLAARQIRWVLRDMAQELRANAEATFSEKLGPDLDQAVLEPVDRDGAPADLAEWTELHEAIEKLPDEEREAFDLLFYQGLSQPEAADVLGTSLRTLKRRWQRARLLLHDALRGLWPSLG
ncbi:MAG: sigma-70 family RNA polymerase sigma factor [Gemmataceae bacterium]|nr:sigma-70 family RNA polymerase sigma factor [Gemmataceae bacterium]